MKFEKTADFFFCTYQILLLVANSEVLPTCSQRAQEDESNRSVTATLIRLAANLQ